jgi:hypothetical protein
MPAEMSSTPSGYLIWRVLDEQTANGWRIVASSHETVAWVYNKDDAEEIVSLHNKRVQDRADWYGS